MEAIFLGTRRCDPHGAALSYFSKTTEGWPPMMRVNPILDWTYSDVWDFLCSLEIPYCNLYNRGYTSIGGMSDTCPNPLLLLLDQKISHTEKIYRHAKWLDDETKERCGRTTDSKAN